LTPQGKLNWEDYLTSDYRIEDVEKGIEDIRARKALKVLLRFNSEEKA
jgi:Zn-dependent alcohol dehydrogenase